MSDSFYTFSKISQLKKIRADFAVKVLLTERLQALGVSPFRTYLNTVVDRIDDKVHSSRTLYEETLEYVEKEALPDYAQGTSNVFSRQYSFDPKDRIEGLGLIEFENIIIDIVRWLTTAPSINLSNRRLRSLSVEDVHAALKYTVPEINIDEVYVTSVVTVGEERKMFNSRRLVEDVHASLQHDDIPYYHGDDVGVYSVAYSLQEHHLHPHLTPRDISNLVIDVVPGFLA